MATEQHGVTPDVDGQADTVIADHAVLARTMRRVQYMVLVLAAVLGAPLVWYTHDFRYVWTLGGLVLPLVLLVRWLGSVAQRNFPRRFVFLPDALLVDINGTETVYPYAELLVIAPAHKGKITEMRLTHQAGQISLAGIHTGAVGLPRGQPVIDVSKLDALLSTRLPEGNHARNEWQFYAAAWRIGRRRLVIEAAFVALFMTAALAVVLTLVLFRFAS
ncbi:MAG: hypothetical protein HYS20_06500 [Rhodocyclales bacterium]|nr:hypothetical protein [Rhodocyclales bacterium]